MQLAFWEKTPATGHHDWKGEPSNCPRLFGCERENGPKCSCRDRLCRGTLPSSFSVLLGPRWAPAAKARMGGLEILPGLTSSSQPAAGSTEGQGLNFFASGCVASSVLRSLIVDPVSLSRSSPHYGFVPVASDVGLLSLIVSTAGPL